MQSRPPVVVLFNQPSPHTRPEDRAAEAGVIECVTAVAGSLARTGHSVETLGIVDDLGPLIERLRGGPAVFVNFCEGFGGRSAGEAHVTGLLELFGAPYTGSPPEAMLLCLDKIRTKRLLAGSGLPTPPFLEFGDQCSPLSTQYSGTQHRGTQHSSPGSLPDEGMRSLLAEAGLAWPIMVKPAATDASQGIDQDSVVKDIESLRRAIARTAAAYGWPVLAEQFIDGREFNLAVVGDPANRVLPVSEIVFERSDAVRWPIVTYDAKWTTGSADDRATVPRCPADIDSRTAGELGRLAVAATRATGCRDYVRVDMRLSPDGRPYILEVNANPDLSPGAGLDRQLRAAGIPRDQFLADMVRWALCRTPLTPTLSPADGGEGELNSTSDHTSHVSDRSSHVNSRADERISTDSPSPPSAGERVGVRGTDLETTRAGSQVELRGVHQGDRDAIRDLLVSCGNFREEEIDVGVELVDETTVADSAGDYQFILAEVDGRVVGYSCFGATEMTDGVWDLYWIAVHPSAQGLGIGAKLQEATERHIRAAGGRLVLAETSSLPSYAAARSFYLRQGYQLMECLADFYREGDDRLTFGKRV
jgi:D-alanine-D-alanine ligase